MNNPITDIVLKYAKEKNTDYALLIYGKWGCGKTFYWDRVLSKEITRLKLKPIYISLNGISSVSHIMEQLVSTPDYLKEIDGNLKIPEIGLSIKSIIEIYNNLAVRRTLRKKSNSLFVCFDDLERVSSKITYDEVLGFINTNFIEHNNVKTIFLTNITKDELKEENRVMLEKYFERALKFDFNAESIIESVSKLYEEDDKEYFDFLQKNRKYIIELINDAKIENIRTIKFSIRILWEIFSCSNRDDIKKLSKSIILFTISIANEFKRGKIKTDAAENPKLYTTIFQYTHRSEIMDILESQENKNSELKKDEIYNYNDLYFKKYIKDKRENDFHYFNSIYRFILTGRIERNAIKNEINETLGKVTDWDFVYDKVYNFKDLPDDKFQKYYNDLIKYVKTGKYSLYKYLSLYNLISNVLSNYTPLIQEEEIFKIFLEGLSIKEEDKNLSEYQKDSIRSLISKINISTDYAQRIKDNIITIHNNHQKTKSEIDVNKFFEYITKEKRNIEEQYFMLESKPIFSIYTYDKLYKLIKKCENFTLVTINNLLVNLYNNIKEKRIEEQEIEIEKSELTKLKSKLIKYMKTLDTKKCPIKKGNIKTIIDSISEIEKN